LLLLQLDFLLLEQLLSVLQFVFFVVNIDFDHPECRTLAFMFLLEFLLSQCELLFCVPFLLLETCFIV